jgi:UPF0716 family protein affecting phage T7 exclusion
MGRAMPGHPDQRLGRRASRTVLVALLAILLLPVANASANAFTTVEQVYAQTQTIPPCMFSSGELGQAQSTISNDDQQYEQDLIAAIEQARQERADGACVKRHATATGANVPAGTPVPPSVSPSGLSAPLRIGSATAATDSGLPAPIAILIVLGVLLLLAGVGLCMARLRGWDPAWLARARHSWGEAGYRVSGVWSEFGDWLRGVAD